MHTDYLYSAMRQLRDHLTQLAPREKKLEQINQAERLLFELDSGRDYSYEYLCHRITNDRPDSYPDLRLSGREARHDLRLFVEDLSDSANVSATDAGERVMTVEQLAKQFEVSTKTISRWRRHGLVSRRFVFDGRKRVGFLASSVERFIATNEEKVRRGTQFSQLTEEERQRILERARRLAEAGGCPSEVTKRLARFSGRSPETIRYTIKQFDRDNPSIAIFPDHTGSLREETRQRIYQQYRRGEPAEVLARRFCRTKTGIYRIVGEAHAKRILELPLEYIPNELFAKVRTERQESEILGPAPPGQPLPKRARLPTGLPPYLASLYEIPLLGREREVHLFRKMNYLKYKASKLRESLDPSRPRSGLMGQIEKLYDESVAVKNEIISANLRLVVSIAKRHVGQVENFFELVSDGNISLIRAVEKFDFARGNKFSTYATWALMKNFARTIPDAHRRRDRFRTAHGEMLATTEDGRSDQHEQESAQSQLESQIGRILDCLDEREKKIIITHFGLDSGQEPLTLKEVGAKMGVTKERIRQIEARALSKLREALQKEKSELLESIVERWQPGSENE